MATLNIGNNELRRPLFRGRHGAGSILYRYIFEVLPLVGKLLRCWGQEAQKCNDHELRCQALASLSKKDFHCQGGAIFAVPYPAQRNELLKLITAYQTICDYLDNLCDRANFTNGQAFQQLHLSLIDALTPGSQCAEYYKYYPYKDDGGYLEKLVNQCRSCVGLLPAWGMVQPEIIRLVALYSELQVKKHLQMNIREKILKDWALNEREEKNQDLYWQEFAAACGSTLAVFALMGLAAKKDLEQNEIERIVQAYFPWICSLHILLDYFIDQEEDRAGGDLNFTFYYKNQDETMERLKLCIHEANRAISLLENQPFAQVVIKGLLAMYLSDRKVREQGLGTCARELLSESGFSAYRIYHLCRLVRKFL